ncbi:hypothetical protein ACHAWF_018451 [Thalassiosira exigua]
MADGAITAKHSPQNHYGDVVIMVSPKQNLLMPNEDEDDDIVVLGKESSPQRKNAPACHHAAKRVESRKAEREKVSDKMYDLGRDFIGGSYEFY